MMYQVYTLARCGLLTISLLVTLMIVVYVCSNGVPVAISAHGQAERVLKSGNTASSRVLKSGNTASSRVLKSGNTACSHDESRRYLQELVSISTY